MNFFGGQNSEEVVNSNFRRLLTASTNCDSFAKCFALFDEA